MKNEIIIKIQAYGLEDYFQAWEEIAEKTGLIPEEFLPYELAVYYEKFLDKEAEKLAKETVDGLKAQLNNGEWLDKNWYRLAKALEDELERKYG